MQRIREEQRLSVLNPDIEGQDSDPDDPEGTRRLGSRAKAKGKNKLVIGRIWLSVSIVNRTYEIWGITQVTPLCK